MKKNSTLKNCPYRASGGRKQTRLASKEAPAAVARKWTIGLDLGDRFSCCCVLDEAGTVVDRGMVVTEKGPLEVLFGKLPPSTVALEVGTHSPWISWLIEALGHEVIVANARRVKLISEKQPQERPAGCGISGAPGASGPDVIGAGAASG